MDDLISNVNPESRAETLLASPDKIASVRDLFGVDSDMEVPAFSEADERVPDLDPTYVFDPSTTLAICAGFAKNRRVMVQGYHGTGKSTHIEQVAARLNWPMIRINLDAHISRIDLVGRDAIVLREGQQVTEFREGLLPWALQHPVALVFDEYDAGRPDVMFVIQRVLEAEGKLTLLDQNRVIRPNPWFRLFATTNTVGLGDTTGLYHGTQQINQGQMDRWNIVVTLNYLPAATEARIVLAKSGEYDHEGGRQEVERMKKLRLVAAAPAALLLMAASGYVVTPTKNRILPAEDKLVPGQEFTVKKGEIFYRRPVGRAWSAVLGGELKLTIAGKSATLPK